MKMRSLYLILAATSVAVTCEPQHNNNDIIWYPVEDEDGVFISIYGEKHRATHNANWRSHRRARYSGMEHPAPLPLSYDPTVNRDPSFFHNINERRPLIPVPPIPKVPPAFQNQQFSVERPNKRPQGQASPVENIQDIFNEVFDYNKYPPVSESSGSRPEATNQWGNRPETTNQWGNHPGTTNQWGNHPGTTNQWGNHPGTTNQWGNHPGTTNQWGNHQGSTNQWSNRPGSTSQWGNPSNANLSGMQRPGTTSHWGNRPGTTSQWGNPSNANLVSGVERPGNVWEPTSRPPVQRPITSNQQGNSRPTRPTDSEWINTNRPSNRPTSQSDKLIFPDEVPLSTSLTSTTTTTPSSLVPTDPPTMSPCERLCPVTPQFNPVCGTDGVTYTNAGRLKCASMCGKNVRLAHHGNCGRTSLVTPLVSQSPKEKFQGFWIVDN